MKSSLLNLLVFAVVSTAPADSAAGPLLLNLRDRVEAPGGSGSFEVRERRAEWDPARTAVVICDMWDQHWCRSATARVAEMAPRMN
ncbi:MAG: hypothetical protein H7A45_21875, partial [Verrucomicrobiales bacterium]|nr:hypothetical protein [Verrucomicrobiales bacterium]